MGYAHAIMRAIPSIQQKFLYFFFWMVSNVVDIRPVTTSHALKKTTIAAKKSVSSTPASQRDRSNNEPEQII
jgi:hypothetical protein